jgi:DNA-binding GntR family transcriptional regulator
MTIGGYEETILPKTDLTVAEAPLTKPARRSRTNLSELAYDRLEEMIVSCRLRPGLFLSIQDLQEQMEIGRTPIHQAVSRLAADTLITIRPRHGLQITAIDLTRERTLLPLRRDLERFVVRLAAERARSSHRQQLAQLSRQLQRSGRRMTIREFNQLDRQIDQLLIDAAGEAFLAHTLRPLHTLFRRIGYIYHRWVHPQEGMDRTLSSHLAIIEAVAAGRVKDAVASSDQLIAFGAAMLDQLSTTANPLLFDCNLEMRAAS